MITALATPMKLQGDEGMQQYTFCRPTSLGSLCVPPKPGSMPRDSSGNPIFVPGVQRRALQAIAVSHPPPKAMPSTAATVGFGPLSSSSQKAELILLSMPPPPDCVRNCCISKPAENLPPWPVTTIAFTSDRLCASRAWLKREASTAHHSQVCQSANMSFWCTKVSAAHSRASVLGKLAMRRSRRVTQSHRCMRTYRLGARRSLGGWPK